MGISRSQGIFSAFRHETLRRDRQKSVYLLSAVIGDWADDGEDFVARQLRKF
jgi:hypothetical protein